MTPPPGRDEPERGTRPVEEVTEGALHGWRVLELAADVPARFCAKILSDLGADVVMVEPPGGHAARGGQPRRADGLSARFVYLSTGKQSVVVPTGPEGEPLLRALAVDTDMIVTDLGMDTIDDLLDGCCDPTVVCVRPFGSTGPNAGNRAHHLTLFHSAGEGSTLPSGLGWEMFPDREPLQLGSEIGYFDAGWNAALAALAACYDARRSGRARRVDVSVQESLLTLSRTRMNRFLNEGVCIGREKSRYGITGMMRCLDGWVQLVGIREEQWDRLLARPEGGEFQEAGFGTEKNRADDQTGLGEVLAKWCAAMPKERAARILSEIGAPAGIFAEPRDLLASEQLAHRGFLQDVGDGRGGGLVLPAAPYRLSRTPVRLRPAPEPGSATGFTPRQPMQRRPLGSQPRPGGRPLDGIRVLDFTWAAAGPYATLLLGFLGADVIKVESTRRLDPARSGFVARYDGIDHSPIFNELSLNKRSLQVDLTQPEGRAIVMALASDVDVVVDNFRPGVMQRLGLGPDALLEANPRLVVASSSANGSTGPDAMGAGLASIFAATGGLSTQTGYPDGPPTEVADPMDYRSGTAFAVAILAALVHRDRTGESQQVDLSSREVVAASCPDAFLAWVLGVPWVERPGNGHHSMAPHGVYPSADGGWVAIAVGSGDEWAALCQILARTDWYDRFATIEERSSAGEVLDTAIAAWTTTRTASEAAEQLQGAGVPASAVMTFAMLASDPHLAAREVFAEVDHPALGLQKVMRPPWRFSGAGPDALRPGPLMGADNEAILEALDRLPAVPPERRPDVFR